MQHCEVTLPDDLARFNFHYDKNGIMRKMLKEPSSELPGLTRRMENQETVALPNCKVATCRVS